MERVCSFWALIICPESIALHSEWVALHVHFKGTLSSRVTNSRFNKRQL